MIEFLKNVTASPTARSREIEREFLFSRFLYQVGFGSIAAAVLWCYLTSVDWQPIRVTVLPLMIFGIALPWSAISIPAHIVSTAVASGRFLMLVSLVLGVLALAVSVGRLIFSWDQAFVILLFAIIVSVGILGQSIWGRLWMPTRSDEKGPPWSRDGLLTCGGWIAGLIFATVASLGGSPHAALWLGAAFMFTSGWLVRSVPRRITSANWLSNRSALRLFSSIENACRSRRSRLILIRVFWFSGASLSLMSMISGGWDTGVPNLVEGGLSNQANFPGFAWTLLALVAGLGIGSLPSMRARSQSFPAVSLFGIGGALPAAALGMMLLPPLFQLPLAVAMGACVGLVMGAASRDLRDSFGAIFSFESDVLMSTVAGAGGILFGGCFWLGHSIAGFGPLLLGAQVVLFLGFTMVWRRTWIGPTGEGTAIAVFDPWYPGKFKKPSSESLDDPCLVSVAYDVAPEQREAFEQAIQDLAHLRQKQGALFWTLVESAENPEVLKEQFIVESQAVFQDAVRNETAEERETKQRVFDLNRWESLPCESRHRVLEA